MFYNELLHVDVSVLADQQRHINSVGMQKSSFKDIPGAMDDRERLRERNIELGAIKIMMMMTT